MDLDSVTSTVSEEGELPFPEGDPELDETILVPENSEQWNKVYLTWHNLSTHYSKTLTLKQHNEAWKTLLKTVDLMPNPKLMFLKVYKEALETMPMSANQESTEWTDFIEMFYNKVIDKSFAPEDLLAEKEASKKLYLSYGKAETYWDTKRKCEERLMKALGKQPEDITAKIADIYKMQFSNPYRGMENDYQNFINFAKSNKLALDEKVLVQNMYFETAEDARKIATFYPQVSDKKSLYHHFEVQEYIVSLIEKDKYDTVFVLCEEYINSDIENTCYYYMYIKALKSMENTPGVEEKLLYFVKRGLLYGKTGCVVDCKTFLIQQALIISTASLQEHFQDLVQIIIENNPPNVQGWLAVSEAVIMSTKCMVQNNNLEMSDLRNQFERCINPITMEFFTNNAPLGEEFNHIKKDLVQLFRVWARCLQTTKLESDGIINDIWNEILANTTNVPFLMAYLDAIKCNDSDPALKEALYFTIGRLEQINETEETSFESRKSHLIALKDLFMFKMTQGTPNEQLNILDILTVVNAKYTLKYNEQYHLYNSDVNTSISNDTESAFIVPEQDDSSKWHSSRDKNVNKKLQTATVTPLPNQPSSRGTGYPIFVSNLDFRTSEEEIMDALRNENINVIAVKLKRNIHGKSMGYGTVEVETKEQAERAINELDRILINGRPTFISRHKEEQKYPAGKNVQAAVIISGISGKWKNMRRLENALSVNAPVKSLVLEDKGDTAEAIVEFHTANDANTVYQNWKNGFTLQSPGIQMTIETIGKTSHFAEVSRESKPGHNTKRRMQSSGAVAMIRKDKFERRSDSLKGAQGFKFKERQSKKPRTEQVATSSQDLPVPVPTSQENVSAVEANHVKKKSVVEEGKNTDSVKEGDFGKNEEAPSRNIGPVQPKETDQTRKKPFTFIPQQVKRSHPAAKGSMKRRLEIPKPGGYIDHQSAKSTSDGASEKQTLPSISSTEKRKASESQSQSDEPPTKLAKPSI